MRRRPAVHIRQIDAVLAGEIAALDLHIPGLLLHVGSGHQQPRHAVDDVDGQAKLNQEVNDPRKLGSRS
jgi:hypothetical protein